MPRSDQSAPNLLIIQTDQLSWWALSCYDGDVIDTPHIDRLATDGARLTQCFANSAQCTPSRGTFLTGRYPHCHGARSNHVPLHSDEITFAEVLRDNGYHTGYAGKWHLAGRDTPGWMGDRTVHGFDDCRYMFNSGHWKKIVEADDEYPPAVYPYEQIGDAHTYPTDWLAGKAQDFIEQHRDDRFCYVLSLPDPHAPNHVRAPFDEWVPSSHITLPPTFFQDNLPDWATQRKAHWQQTCPELYDPETLRQWLAWYYGEVALIDHHVGRLIDQLERLELLENTIVVFTSDHGDFMGAHGLMDKNEPYEAVHRVPMLIRWPAVIPRGTTVDRVVSLADFHPTILALMGMESSARPQGRDFSALLRGESLAWRDEAMLYHHPDFDKVGLVTPQYHLALVRDGEDVLFDRRADSEQVHNLYNDPSCRAVVRSLTSRVIEHHAACGSPASNWLDADDAGEDSEHAGEPAADTLSSAMRKRAGENK